jgi:hypothetical protein
MGHTVRTVGPLQAPNDRGSPRMDWSQIDWDHRGTERPKPALSDLPSGLRHRRSIGLSGMRGNAHVPFLGGGGLATGSCYPTLRCAPASGSS